MAVFGRYYYKAIAFYRSHTFPCRSLLSLSTVLLNSRDRPKNIWLLEGMHLGTQWFKIQNTKNLPQRFKYSSNNAISLFKQAKSCNICPLENFKKNRTRSHFHLTACRPASLSTGTDLEPIPLSI